LRIVIWTIVILLFLGGGGFLAAKQLGLGSKQTAGTQVRLTPAERGSLTEIVAAPGTVVPETKVSISSRVNAKISELPFKEGDRVSKGSADGTTKADLLVRLDSSEIMSELRAAQARYQGQLAEIDAARARLAARPAEVRELTVQLESRQTELQRQEQLLANQDVSQQSVDDLRAAVSQIKVQIEGRQAQIEAERKSISVQEHEASAKQAEIDRIQESLNYTTITTPIDGLVTKVNAEVGEIAVTGTMNNRGTVILEVADLSKMLVEARVDETDVASLKVGQVADVRIQAFPDDIFKGVVQTVALARTESETDRSTYYEVKIVLDTQGKSIVSGLTADVEIKTRTNENVIRVPSQSVVARSVDDLPADIRDKPEVDKNRSFATVVYRLVSDKAVVTPVRVGPSDLTHSVILSGLAENDPVVSGPFKVLDSIRHDQSIVDERTATTRPAR
jgi:HlyD family secretion protein